MHFSIIFISYQCIIKNNKDIQVYCAKIFFYQNDLYVCLSESICESLCCIFIRVVEELYKMLKLIID